MGIADDWQACTEELVQMHNSLYGSLGVFMDEVQGGLEGEELHLPSVLFAVEVFKGQFGYESTLPHKLARSIIERWPIAAWFVECFYRHCDDSIMTVGGINRKAPEHEELRVLMALGCLTVKCMRNPTYAKIAEQTSSIFALALVNEATLVPAVLAAVRLPNCEEIINEFAVEVDAKKTEIARLRQGSFADRLRGVLAWSNLNTSIFLEPLTKLQWRFVHEVSNEFAAHLQERIEAKDVDAVAVALHIGIKLDEALVVRNYLRNLTGLPLPGLPRQSSSDYVLSVAKFEQAAYAVEPLQERVEASDGYLVNTWGDYHLSNQAGMIGLLKRWYEATPDDPRIQVAVRLLGRSSPVAFRRKLWLYGLDALVRMVPVA